MVGVLQKLAFNQTLKRLRDNDPKLTVLELTVRNLTSEDARELASALKNNHTLIYLYLGNNGIGDAGAHDLAEALKSNDTLTFLDLYNNEITDAGAHDLAEALKSNRTLTTLALSDNPIRAAGANDLAGALKSNRTLTTLELQGTQIGVAGMRAMVETGFELDGIIYKRSTAVAPDTPVAVGKYTGGEANRNAALDEQRRRALKNGEGI